MYAVVARYEAREGKDDDVAARLATMIPHSQSEPECLIYTVNRSPEQPRHFLLYEQYRDEAAFHAHTETEAFKEIILGQVRPLLAQRTVEFFTTVEPA